MSLKSLVNKIEKSQLTEELIERYRRKERLLIKGGNRTARSLIITSIAKRSEKNLLFQIGVRHYQPSFLHH